MPPTRKVSGGRQATLSFNHRVTKPSVQRQSAKEAALLTDKAKEKEAKETKEVKEAKEEKQKDEEEVVEAKKANREVAAEDEGVPGAEDEENDEEPAAKVIEPAVVIRPEAEIKADAVSDAQVRRYWRAIEAEGTARRVHQEGLDLSEKVLRHFDVSSHFGPCVGITRKSRWLRAQRLGLSPPIEVLAVMLKEEAKGVEGIQRSSFDDILNAPMAA
ncbi:DNA polymerase delta subunit 4 [Sporothrix brasiliensis 5110]|uniref:DNA polymerase delta subunit 4 n=1 Tax=Sporothrix brasiliensis 5110 TaxID=1398154 RepID=A0A0C2FDK3_9PEZI|nr:DNA polymerase delta subunit 4 [Sporothrix brasiliensis 5110]KIH89188.1 DNA polymerase delta subunit 4 [Sporothrix brasiliensis 5110]